MLTLSRGTCSSTASVHVRPVVDENEAISSGLELNAVVREMYCHNAVVTLSKLNLQVAESVHMPTHPHIL